MARVSHSASGICSLCRAPVAERATAPTIEVKLAPMFSGATSQVGAAGRYCGETCLAAMKAVDAVRELQDADEIADALLAVYRRGGGPSAALVLEAVNRVASRRSARNRISARLALNGKRNKVEEDDDAGGGSNHRGDDAEPHPPVSAPRFVVHQSE